MSMTDEQIVKALEQCGIYEFDDKQESCKECPFCGCDYCKYELCDFALALIKRQQAEIEDLREIIFTDRTEAIKKLKAEAIKEFAENLKSRIRKDIDEQGMFPLPYTKKAYDTVMIFIDNLVREMTEKEGGKG